MKKLRAVALALAVSGWIGWGMGCGKQEEPGPPSVSESQREAERAAADARKKAAAEKAAAQKQAEAQKTAVQPAATGAASSATDQAQGLIEKVKTLIAEKKYTEALAALKDLSAMKLAPEQQKIVDELKAQAQKAMADAATEEAKKKAAGAVGGLLGK